MPSKRRFILGAATSDRMTLAMPVRGTVLAPVRWLKKVSFGAISDIQEVSFKERNKAILGALQGPVQAPFAASFQACFRRHARHIPGAPAMSYLGAPEAPFQAI